MKKLRIGRRRAQAAEMLSPLERALLPALEDGSWRVPDRFNLTRDLVEVLGRVDSKRQALTILGMDGIVEPRTFRQLAEGAARWAHILRSKGVAAGDRVIVLSRLNEDWIDLALGCVKVGAIFAPAPPTLTPQALESRVAVTDAALVVAGEESEDAIERMSFTPEVHHVRSGRMRRASDVPVDEPTADTFSRDVAFLVWTAGTEGDPKPVAHTHGSLFAARALAEHWLQADAGDLVWCTAGPGSPLALSTVAGAWVRGAEVIVHEGDFEPAERLDLIRRVGPTVLCQPPSEYDALAELRQLARYRPPRLRRLLTTGDYLESELLETFREQWGLEIQVGYGEAETGVVATTRASEERERAPGEIGAALPGHHLAAVDDQGNELPPGVEGRLAVRGRPPTLFAGYWESPEETKRAFRGDWYLTGDVAVADESGVLRFLARAGELITSRGRTFGPHEVERALAAHDAVATSAVVGVRDLERGGQFVRAFVVLEPGIESSEQLEAELRQFVGQTLPEQQVRRVELRERPVSGRPLWEAPPTSEPEPEPPTTAELGIEPDPVLLVAPEPPAPAHPVEPPAPEIAPVEQVVPWPEPVADPEADPVVALQPGPVAEPERDPVVEPEPVAESAPLDHALEPTSRDETPLALADHVATPTAPLAPEAGPSAEAEPPGEAVAALADETARLDEPVAPPETESVSAEPAVEPTAQVGPPAVEPVSPPLEPTRETHEAAELEIHAGQPRHLPEFPEPAELIGQHLGDDEPAREPVTPPEKPATATTPPQADAPEARAPEDVVTPEIVAAPAVAETTDAAPAHPEEEADEATPTPQAQTAPASPEPLPDYIVSPADAYANVPPAPDVVHEPEPETKDLGPLPEYVVDPERRLEVVAETPDPTPPPTVPRPEAAPDPSLENHPLAGLARPHVSIPIPADDDERPKPSRPRSRGRTRPAPTTESRRKRGRSEGEPGDEGLETGWMQRLSSRLDAYAMSEEEAERRRKAAEGGGADSDAERDGDTS